MGTQRNISVSLYYALFFICCFLSNQSSARENPLDAPAPAATAVLNVNSSFTRKMPDNFFGIFFEEINHAGAGGIWSELVENRGFESATHSGPAGTGPIDPWVGVGDDSVLSISLDHNSKFERNKVALRMEVLCDKNGSNACPPGGVGVYNPGFWGMNIEKGKTYRLNYHVRTNQTRDVTVTLRSADGVQILATHNTWLGKHKLKQWITVDVMLKATASNTTARLQVTTNKKGSYWIDQVSLMPTDTHKGHGFRKDLFAMLKNLDPKFMRFPGGTFVQGYYEANSFKWKETVGEWHNRPGHYNDAWNYWIDDGMGYYEYLLLAEDLGTAPIWVFNNGMGAHDYPYIKPNQIHAYVKDALDGIEFARGPKHSTWGSIRAKMGHPQPFKMKYVSVGNENCMTVDQHDPRPYYEAVVYPKFYSAIKKAYPDMNIISNCDATRKPLENPAELFDFHTYPVKYDDMYNLNTVFDKFNRTAGPKVFVSEYAVHMDDAGSGNFHGALGEAAFLIGLERNSDIVDLACYAPLFANVNQAGWRPNAIWFDSWRHYGTPSYWVQYMFKESSGGTLLSSTLETNSSIKVVASAIISHNATSKVRKLKIKVVNYGAETVDLKISISNFYSSISASESKMIVLSSGDLADQNSIEEPNKVVPQSKMLANAGSMMDVVLSPHTFTSYDLLLK